MRVWSTQLKKTRYIHNAVECIHIVRTDSKAIKLIVISLIHCNVAVRQFITISPSFFFSYIFGTKWCVHLFIWTNERRKQRAKKKTKKIPKKCCTVRVCARVFCVVYVFDFTLFIGLCSTHIHKNKEKQFRICLLFIFVTATKLNQCKAIYSMKNKSDFDKFFFSSVVVFHVKTCKYVKRCD